jgi:nucleotide-binding universal stress UspA family protein
VTSDPVFRRIVVPTDFSAGAEKAWVLAQRVAKACASELVLVHVLADPPPEDEGPFSLEEARKVYARAKEWVENTLESWRVAAAGEGLTVRVALRTGVAYQEIVALATEEHADLVVIGTHGRGGIDRALLGSVTDRAVRMAPCPVLTVREPE